MRNLLHGDHMILFAAGPENCLVTIPASCEVGGACTTLAKGQAYCLYNACTLDVGGERGSAE